MGFGCLQILFLPLLLGVFGAAASQAENKLFYVDGYSGEVTLVSLDGSVSNCRLPDFPGQTKEVYPAALTYMESLNAVVGCEGYTDDRCWAYDGSGWSALPSTGQNHCSWDSHGVMVEEHGWWINSVQHLYGKTCQTDVWMSEIFTGKEWIKGPHNPPAGYAYRSCSVQLNANITLLVGGYPNTRGIWAFDWNSETWAASGTLNAPRYEHGCALLKDKGVLIVGGDNASTSELYDPNTGVSTIQQDLPQGVQPAKPLLLTWNNTVIGLFDKETLIYEYMEDGTWAALQGVRLPETDARKFEPNKAVLVPDSFALGCL